MSESLRESVERFRAEHERELTQIIEDEIRESIVANALAWIGVVVGAFVINLLLLMAIAGG
jgi:hypothetical protein